MSSLSISTPDLKYEPVDTGLAMMEKPIEIRCGGVLLPDGSGFSMESLGTCGFFTLRQVTSGGAVEIWDDENRQWKDEAATPLYELKATPFFFKEEDPSFPWQGLVVAAGAKDKDDLDQFAKSDAGFPRYAFRARFSTDVDEQTISGLSPQSVWVCFTSVLDAARAGLRIGENEKLDNAEEIHLFLRNEARLDIGTVSIYKDNGRARIEIAKTDGGANAISTIRIDADGSIQIVANATNPSARGDIRLDASGNVGLHPAPGRVASLGNTVEISESGNHVTLSCTGTLTVSADQLVITAPKMEAGRIRYQPADAAGNSVGSKRWLGWI